MNILIIGQGGREHALAWKVKKSSLVDNVFVLPGNDGMSDVAQTINILMDDYNAIVEFAMRNKIDLTIIGSEQPLIDGLVDLMQKHNLNVFGPSQGAAMIEGSKTFAKQLMSKYNIPTATYELIHKISEAKEYLEKATFPIVIKVDGLAAGKGVVISNTYENAIDTIRTFLIKNEYVILESFLEGIEFSLIALVHHNKVYPFDLAQDYKRAFDNDEGPNTGGMGSYSPVNLIPSSAIDEAMSTIMKPIAEGMLREGIPFTGFLYGGLMLTKDGVKVIEFNARFGDPEAEVILPRLKNDLVKEIMSVLNNEPVQLDFINETCVGVVLASKGYPVEYSINHPIEIQHTDNRLLFHMGTRQEGEQFMTNGGRVLMNVSFGCNLIEASENCYETLKSIQSEVLFYRNDIGDR